jgi:hypothetical protein
MFVAAKCSILWIYLFNALFNIFYDITNIFCKREESVQDWSFQK